MQRSNCRINMGQEQCKGKGSRQRMKRGSMRTAEWRQSSWCVVRGHRACSSISSKAWDHRKVALVPIKWQEESVTEAMVFWVHCICPCWQTTLSWLKPSADLLPFLRPLHLLLSWAADFSFLALVSISYGVWSLNQWPTQSEALPGGEHSVSALFVLIQPSPIPHGCHPWLGPNFQIQETFFNVYPPWLDPSQHMKILTMHIYSQTLQIRIQLSPGHRSLNAQGRGQGKYYFPRWSSLAEA